MSGVTVRLEPARAGDLAYVEGLLAANDLPNGDVGSKPECFYVGYVDDAPVGVGGIERYGPDALLRSVAVETERRGEGVGTALCAALEAAAEADGVRTLYLLTTTAAAFFERLGYVETDRGGAPDAIRGTSEFTDYCPSTATCLRKSL